MKLSILSLPLLAFASLHRRDDSTEGGGAPSNNGGSNPQLSNWVNRPGQSPNYPSRDNFYRKNPSDLSKFTNGQIIEKRNISVSGSYAGIDTAYQIKLKSEDAHSANAVTWASVLIPRSDKLTGNVIVFELPEDAASIDCAPTYQLFSRQAIPEIQALVSQGYVVVVPDYEGQRGSFSVGKLAGKQILDAARAAIKIPDIKHSNQTVKVGLWGYGTSAHAAGWAAELAPSYAPELPLKGSALGGVVTDLIDWASNVDGSPLAGNYVSSLLGMATQYKDVSDALQDAVIPRRRNQFNAAASRCAPENIFHFFDTNVTSTFFASGEDILQVPKVKSVYELNNLGQNPPKTNIFVYQGSADREASPSAVHRTLAKYCKAGTPVQYREFNNQGHVQTRQNGYNDALSFFQKLFNGSPIDNNCEAFTTEN